MKLASITQRLSGLGSDKWAVHIEGKRRAGAGEDLIFLSIGEPDAPTPTAIMDVVNTQMRAGPLQICRQPRRIRTPRRPLGAIYQKHRPPHQHPAVHLPARHADRPVRGHAGNR